MQKKQPELIDFITTKITEMVEKSEPGRNHFNKAPLKQEELKPIDIIDLIGEEDKTMAQIS